MAKVTEDDVLQVLHPTIWKTTNKIWEELRVLKGVDHPGGISYGSFYGHLKTLEGERLIESRMKTDCSPELLRVRGGHWPREHKLTNQGLKRKIEHRRASGNIPGLLPQES